METPCLTKKITDNRKVLGRSETGDKSSAQCHVEPRFQDGPGTRAVTKRAMVGRLVDGSIVWQPSCTNLCRGVLSCSRFGFN